MKYLKFLLPMGILLVLVLFLVMQLVRWLMVEMVLWRSPFARRERLLITAAGLRGAVPIALAIEAAASGTGTCIINADGYCWCGQKWDGTKMSFPKVQQAPSAQSNVTGSDTLAERGTLSSPETPT